VKRIIFILALLVATIFAMECYYCKGTGIVTCGSCSGVGYVGSCISCDGTGVIDRPCSACLGSGRSAWGNCTCSSCRGLGVKREKCWSCNGTGHGSKCYSCNGLGFKRCPQCRRGF